MKKVIIQIGRLFKPISGYGTLGMYHWFILLSEWVLIVSVIASIIFEINNSTHTGWVQFFENYAIGIACSDIIVLATSIAQFISVRNKHAKEFYSSASAISLFLYEFKHKYELMGKDKEQCKKYSEKLLIHIQNYASNAHEQLYWFSKRKGDLYTVLDGELCSIVEWLNCSPNVIYQMNYNDFKNIIVHTNEFGKLIFPNRINVLERISTNVQIDAAEEKSNVTVK